MPSILLKAGGNASCNGLSKSTCGFALVIALSLMAFVLLLILSISTLVQVETSSARLGIDQLEAEQNALLGLYVGVGELQAAAGPDGRVTVSSDLFDTSPSTAAIDGVATRHYTGVYRAHQTAQPLELFRQTQNEPEEVMKWLASAENILTNPVDAPALAYSQEMIAIARVYNSDTSTMDQIEVGKIPISDDSTGSYGWWVSDEGLKAKFNVVDSGLVNLDVDAPFDSAKHSLIHARASNFSHVSENFSLKFSELVDNGVLSKLSPFADLNLLSADWGDWYCPKDPLNREVSANVNPAFTLYSYGLPVDVTQGRLKEDLTVYLESGVGLDEDEHILRGHPNDATYVGPSLGASFSNDPRSDNLPRFGLLRSWNDLGKQFGDTGVARHQPQTNTQHGLHPTVMRAGYSFSIGRVGAPIEDPDNTERMLVNVQPLIFVRLALWNPYNFRLQAEDYLFEISLPDPLLLQWTKAGLSSIPGAMIDRQGFTRLPAELPAGDGSDTDFQDLIDFTSNSIIQPDNYVWHGNHRWLRMTIDTGHDIISVPGMNPGETLNFSPEAAQNPLADAVYLDQSAEDYRPDEFVNYADPVDDEMGQAISNYFVMGPVVQVSVPKSQNFFPEIPARDDYNYNLRYRLNSNTMEDNLAWRFSRITASGPELLVTKDPSKATQVAVNTAGYDWADFGNGVSDNWNNIKRLDPVPSSATHTIYASRHDFWHTTAREGGARQGGDRRNAVRNPRGGILRDDFDLSNWGEEDHRISIYRDEDFEAYWNPSRWRTETDIDTGNLGTVEGYVDQAVDNSTAFLTGTRYTHYDFPRRFGVITSLGQLQHANLNPFGFGAAHQVGFSRAPYHVSRDSLVETASTSLPNERIDLPYMLNASIWDRFYLSTIPQTGSLGLGGVNPSVLANNRHVLVPNLDGSFPGLSELLASEAAFERSAAHIQIEGAFNINSVSVDAWEALLLQAAGKTLQSEQDGSLNSRGDENFVAFPRFPNPVYGSNDDDVFDALDAQDKRQHAGLFVTDRADIRILAETIVEEVKKRGPFLSLADFINRRLIPDATDLDLDYQGLMGTLDAAVLRASQNAGVLNYQQIFDRRADYNQNLDPSNPSSVVSGAGAYSVDVESAYGAPIGHQNTALEGNSANLTQADILQALAPQLSARSDTFIVRSYGESVDPLSNQMIASVRLEAVVQRVAEPVDTSDSIANPTGSFGRRFIVTDIRWVRD